MPIVHGPWEKYPWKNELAVQSERVAIHYAEMMSDAFDGEHCPMDMLNRPRRLCNEKNVREEARHRQARCEKIPVRTFQTLCLGEFRRPYIGHS